MIAPLQHPVTAVQVAAYLKRHLRQVRDWPRSRLLAWVAWFMQRDRALILLDGRDRICGVALGRFVPAPLSKAEGRILHDEPAARLLWIDAIAAHRPEAVPQMLRLLAANWGDREAVAGECFNRDGELRMFPMKTLNRFFGG